MVRPMRVRYGRPQTRIGQPRNLQQLQASEFKMEDRLEASYRNLERILGWVTMADNKVLIALTFQGATVAGVVWIAISLGSSFRHLLLWQDISLGTVLGLFFVFFCVSLVKSFQAISPAIKPLDQKDDHGHQFFFGTIAAMSLDEFKWRMQSLQPEEIEEWLIQLTYINAQIAHEKFKHLKTAFTALGLEVMSLMLASLVIIMRQVT
jgi:hypothetical protein